MALKQKINLSLHLFLAYDKHKLQSERDSNLKINLKSQL